LPAHLPDYAELHCLTNFTFLRGASRPDELVGQAIRHGYRSLAITDECSVAGVVRAWSGWKEYREYIARLDAFATEAATAAVPVLTPDGKIADTLAAAGVMARRVEPVHAGGIAQVGISKLLRGECTDPATLDANYIRRSDAEIFSAPHR
jgi:hypothetical protein